MGRRSKGFQRFDSLVSKLLTVPKSTITERHVAHKKRAALNPKKRGPKPKKPPTTRPVSEDRAASDEQK